MTREKRADNLTETARICESNNVIFFPLFYRLLNVGFRFEH